jgi:hypothetical protein
MENQNSTYGWVLHSQPDMVVLRLLVRKEYRDFTLDSVHVAFVNGKKLPQKMSGFKRFINKAVFYITDSFTHAELAFRFRTTEESGKFYEIWLSCSILAGGMLHWDYSTYRYASPVWETRKLNMEYEQMHSLFESCRRDVHRGIEFNNWMYVNFLLPIKRDRRLEKVWCSEHVSAKLKEVSFYGFGDVQPYKMDPLELYNRVMETCDTIIVNPVLFVSAKAQGLEPPF